MIRRGQGSDLQAAEKFSEKRWIILTLFTLAFIIFGASWMIQIGDAEPSSSHMQEVRAAAWALWGLVVLAATFSPWWGRPTKAQMRLINDELTAAHRGAARSVGYWLLLSGSAALLFFESYGSNLRVILVGLLSVGIAVPSLVFSALQLHSARDA